MTDVVDQSTRSRMMAGIRSRDTQPERVARKMLHNRGFRYRLQGVRLPGKPDIVLTRHRVVVMVHGCFWHRHQCDIFKWPSTNRTFWRDKINGNVQRDERNLADLKQAGWSVIVIWECYLRRTSATKLDRDFDLLASWVRRKKSGPTLRILE